VRRCAVAPVRVHRAIPGADLGSFDNRNASIKRAKRTEHTHGALAHRRTPHGARPNQKDA